MDAIVVTNHDFYRDLGDTVYGVRVLPGIEISTTRGHVLVIGPDPPANTDPGTLTPEEVVDSAHERACVAIIPHPFRNSTVRSVDAPFDAVEINGKHPRYRTRVEEIARERAVPLVGGSDAHFPFEAGRAYTLVDSDELSPTTLVNAVRDGRVQPIVRETWLIRFIRRWYARVHRIRSSDVLSESLRHPHP
nr:PHP-associated domain-containing protein [Halomarina rubra]